MILTRPAVAGDRDFIVSGWSSSLRPSRDIPFVPMSSYVAIFRPIIERHLARSSALVAHGETGLSFGFIAYDPTVYVASLGHRNKVTLEGYVLYVYVAGPFRRRGVARRLFAAAGISPSQRFGYACRTRSSWELRSKIPLAEYEPFRARYEETTHGRRTERDVAPIQPEAGPAGEAAGREGAESDPGP